MLPLRPLDSLYTDEIKDLTYSKFIDKESSDKMYKNVLPDSVIDDFKLTKKISRGSLKVEIINDFIEFSFLDKDQKWSKNEVDNVKKNIIIIKKNSINYQFPIDSVNYDRSIGIFKGTMRSLNPNKINLDIFDSVEDSWYSSEDPTLFKADEEINGKAVDDLQFLNYFDIDQVDKVKDSGEIDEENDEKLKVGKYDEENLLVRAVRAGIGFMSGPMHNRHKKTIQALFRDKKIYILLATDSLGVGANIKCRSLFIPSLRKPPLNLTIDASSILQLVNRAGRSINEIPTAFIYSTIEDYEYVRDLLSNDPAIKIPELDTNPMNAFSNMSSIAAKEKLTKDVIASCLSNGYDN